MAAHFNYRLQVLLELKKEAENNAEQILKEKKQELASQLGKLELLRLRENKLREQRDQLRKEMLSKPGEGVAITAREVQARSEYVKQVGLNIEHEHSDVLAQSLVVEQAQLVVKEAAQHATEARREVEVLAKHRAKQQERFLRELQAKEDLALDEVGNILYSTRRQSL